MSISVFVGMPRIALGALDGAVPRAAQAVGLGGVRRPFVFARPLSLSTARCVPCQAVRQALSRRPTALTTLNVLPSRLLSTSVVRRDKQQSPPEHEDSVPGEEIHDSPYTLPNALTVARIVACPFLAYSIVHGNFEVATGLLVASGFTDWLDGYLARKWNQKSVMGSVLDPAADKALVTTLVVSLTYVGLLPLPLALLIFGRDFGLSMWAFYLRYISVPKPRTLKRYFDISIPSVEVKPTQISKVNTALQLLLMGVTTVSPLVTSPLMAPALEGLQWIVAGTTIWSGLSYMTAGGFKFVKPKLQLPKRKEK